MSKHDLWNDPHFFIFTFVYFNKGLKVLRNRKLKSPGCTSRGDRPHRTSFLEKLKHQTTQSLDIAQLSPN